MIVFPTGIYKEEKLGNQEIKEKYNGLFSTIKIPQLCYIMIMYTSTIHDIMYTYLNIYSIMFVYIIYVCFKFSTLLISMHPVFTASALVEEVCEDNNISISSYSYMKYFIKMTLPYKFKTTEISSRTKTEKVDLNTKCSM